MLCEYSEKSGLRTYFDASLTVLVGKRKIRFQDFSQDKGLSHVKTVTHDKHVTQDKKVAQVLDLFEFVPAGRILGLT